MRNFKQTTRLAVCLSALLVAGCADRKDQVVCDSGFKTPLSWNAYISEGVVNWKITEQKQNYSKRRMIEGEICEVNVITLDEGN